MKEEEEKRTTTANRKHNFYALESLVSYFSIIPSVAEVLKTIRWLKSKKRVVAKALNAVEIKVWRHDLKMPFHF